LTDVNATYAVLEHHPLGTDAQVVAHYDFLKWLGAAAQAARVLDDGLARFPESWILHDRLRSRILADKGVDGLEPAYETMLQEKIGWPNLEWFAGYASLTAAEFHKRAGRADASLAAYERATAHYEKALAENAQIRASVDHYVALALAGRARIAFEQGDYERATAQLLASFERKPDAAASLDGLNLSPVDTAKMLLAKLKEAQRDDLAASLQAALDALDPELLKLPAYESEGPNSRPQRRDRRRTDQ
jgi:tetratricopeptide (TPR) repeat protein